MASNVSYLIEAIAEFFGLDHYNVAIAWAILVFVGIIVLLVVVSRETEEEKQKKMRID